MFRSVKLSAILTIVSLSFTCLCVSVPNIDAQKGKRSKKKPAKQSQLFKSSLPIFDPSAVCIPPSGDYISVLQIDSNAKATLNVQTAQGSKYLFDANRLSSPNDVLTAIFNKPIVTVRADPSLKFEVVVNILRGARQAVDRCFNVEASTRPDDPYVYIYPEPKEKSNLPVYPNPLLLIVHLDKNSDITLNNEKKGSLSDTSVIRNFLRQLFIEREKNGVLRAYSNDVEKTVRVKAERSATFGDVIKIVDALKEAGASPVGLQIDDTHEDDLIMPFEIDRS